MEIKRAREDNAIPLSQKWFISAMLEGHGMTDTKPSEMANGTNVMDAAEKAIGLKEFLSWTISKKSFARMTSPDLMFAMVVQVARSNIPVTIELLEIGRSIVSNHSKSYRFDIPG